MNKPPVATCSSTKGKAIKIVCVECGSSIISSAIIRLSTNRKCWCGGDFVEHER